MLRVAVCDAGYDISDSIKLPRATGTNLTCAACSRRRKNAHARALDLVAGHSSVECEWFKQSASTNGTSIPSGTSGTQLFNFFSGRLALPIHRPEPRTHGRLPAQLLPFQPALTTASPTLTRPALAAAGCARTKSRARRAAQDQKFWLTWRGGFRVDMAASLGKKTPVRGDDPVVGEIRAWLDQEYLKRVGFGMGPSRPGDQSGFQIDFYLAVGGPAHLAVPQAVRFGMGFGGGGGSAFLTRRVGNIRDSSTNSASVKTPRARRVHLLSQAITILPRWVNRSFQDLKLASPSCFRCLRAQDVYGDEIGMARARFPQKKVATCAPDAHADAVEQGKERGFPPRAGKAVLPVDPTSTRTVTTRRNDPESLLNAIRALRKIRLRIRPVEPQRLQCFRQAGTLPVRLPAQAERRNNPGRRQPRGPVKRDRSPG